MRFRNVDHYIRVLGHDLDYTPEAEPDVCRHVPGSPGKIAELRRRIEKGQALWNEEDITFQDQVATIRPRLDR